MGIEIINNLSFFDGASGMLIAALAKALFSSALGLVICIFATAGHHFLEVRISHVIYDYGMAFFRIIRGDTRRESISKGNNQDANFNAHSEHE